MILGFTWLSTESVKMIYNININPLIGIQNGNPLRFSGTSTKLLITLMACSSNFMQSREIYFLSNRSLDISLFTLHSVVLNFGLFIATTGV